MSVKSDIDFILGKCITLVLAYNLISCRVPQELIVKEKKNCI